MAQSVMDYIFRRIALDYLPFETRSALSIYTAAERQRQLETGSYEESASSEEPDQFDGALTQAMTEVQTVPARPAAPAAMQAPAPSAAMPAAPAVPLTISQRNTTQGAVAGPNSSARRRGIHSSADVVAALQGREADAPICMTCGTKMRPAGSCHVCEGCGATSGCS
jgi:ribonucleoside-diphosphate reductase alpha chain